METPSPTVNIYVGSDGAIFVRVGRLNISRLVFMQPDMVVVLEGEYKALIFPSLKDILAFYNARIAGQYVQWHKLPAITEKLVTIILKNEGSWMRNKVPCSVYLSIYNQLSEFAGHKKIESVLRLNQTSIRVTIEPGDVVTLSPAEFRSVFFMLLKVVGRHSLSLELPSETEESYVLNLFTPPKIDLVTLPKISAPPATFPHPMNFSGDESK